MSPKTPGPQDLRTGGHLIAFEGLDQSGKQTQAERLLAAFRAAGLDAEFLTFPEYTTAIGTEIGHALQGERHYDPDTLQLLYIANRFEFRPQILRWLDEGRMVVCDRVPWPRPDILHKARRAFFGKRTYDDAVTRLRLKQAFGRLIRRATDRGVFVLLDPMMPSRLKGAFPADVRYERVGLSEALALIQNFLTAPQAAPPDRAAPP